jgi:hypothetical protein
LNYHCLHCRYVRYRIHNLPTLILPDLIFGLLKAEGDRHDFLSALEKVLKTSNFYTREKCYFSTQDIAAVFPSLYFIIKLISLFRYCSVRANYILCSINYVKCTTLSY